MASVDTEKQPLLEPTHAHSPDLSEYTEPQWNRWTGTIRLALGSVLAILLLRYAVSFNQWYHSGHLEGSGDRHRTRQGGSQPLIPLPTCENATYTQNATFRFPYHAYFQNFGIQEHLWPQPYGKTVGKVNVVPGLPDQHDAIIVDIQMMSTVETYLDHISLEATSDQVSISSDTFASDAEACTCVHIEVHIKPHLLIWQLFGIQTTVLHIELAQELDLEAFHVSFSSISGSISSSELDWYTPHEMSISSQSGSIFGNWSFGSAVELKTTSGAIDLYLQPKRWSSWPTNKGTLNVSSVTGNVSIVMPFETKKLDLRSWVTNIHSVSGSINASLVHGASTCLGTVSGDIDVLLLPYYVLPSYNNLTTYSASGKTSLSVLTPIYDSYFRSDPLKLMISDHHTVNGVLDLQYPAEWEGRASGHSLAGELRVETPQGNNTCVFGCHLCVESGFGVSRMQYGTISGDAGLELQKGVTIVDC